MKIIITCLILLSSFGVQSKKLFKENKEAIENLEKIYVVTDITIVEDLPDNKVGINKEYNIKFGENLFKNLKNIFRSKIQSSLIHAVNSIGLYEQSNVFIPDSLDVNKKIMLPSFNMEMKNELDNSFIEDINPLVDKSFDQGRPTKMHKKYQKKMLENDYTKIKKLNLDKNEAVLIIISTGIKVPTKKSIGKAVASTILTLGLFTRIETSAINFNTVLISNEGKLLWAGKSLKTSKSSNDKKLIIQLQKIFFGFPIKSVYRK
jgi:hypothetical protein